MNVRKIMTRLNAATARYDVARGGVPEITAQDVAGALALVGDPLARDVFCCLWWPDSTALNRERVLKALRDRIWSEFSRRHRAAQLARLDLHIAEGELAARRSPGEHDRREFDTRHAAWERAHRQLWPGTMATYPQLLRAVLTEFVTPRHCATCKGRGAVAGSNGPRVCAACDGRGEKSQSKAWRANALGMTEANFRQSWEPVYEWTYSLVSDLETTAAAQLARALGAHHEPRYAATA